MVLINKKIVMSRDIGIHGNLFGGILMAWLDESAAAMKYYSLLASILLSSGATAYAPKNSLDGFWRGVFTLPNAEEAPFNFELKGQTAWFINGEERFEIQGVTQKNDSLFIPVDIYDAVLKAKIENAQTLSGVFQKLHTETPDPGIPFQAKQGLEYRFFETPPSASVSLHGKWDLTITTANGTGKTVSLKDPKYAGKVVIVTILGSWCPNCLDETAFLAPWYAANRDRGVEVIGLAFERKNTPSFAKERLEVLKKRYDVGYDLLFAGLADKKYASSVLPALNEVLSFPTTIYIDKKGKVAKGHTGYSGPATGAYYAEFVKEFNKDIDHLLQANGEKR